ncbi:uncharacterized protein A1O9_09343 [Exophiala aquamarina CBS 119918]|uniref:Myb-like domain-containing protein n=1 Tax=Exophiala aquamarina CBS 119918 TaxID=1182545 RepID=A0A072PHA2_9EURO|nr:uncharacterized protein A1O9_09343 [Exophiala aquamarina CBS 119918]KEF54900.1 hypothetical protein A1O9_09343 [Exophiala aquamarina CBS 119918]
MADPSTPLRMPARDLVRWNDDIDKGLMLTIQYCCGESGIKIPWRRIAEVMGPKFTEGSITQHLAKLRKRMVADNIPVPPALKRGYNIKTPSKVYCNGNPTIQYEYVLPLYTETPKHVENPALFYSKAGMTPTPTGTGTGVGERSDYQQTTPTKSSKRSGKARSSVRSKGKGRAGGGGMSDDDEDVFMAALDGDSDDDYGAPPKKKTKATRRAKVEKNGSSNGLVINSDGEEVAMVEEYSPTGPASRTRGVKQDYSMLENGEDDAMQSENETVIDYEGQDSEESVVDLADAVDYESASGTEAREASQYAKAYMDELFPVSEALAAAESMVARSNMRSDYMPFNGNDPFNTGNIFGNGTFNGGNAFGNGQNMAMWGSFPCAAPSMVSNVHQPVMHPSFRDPFTGTAVDSFGDPFTTTSVGYAPQGTFPGMYGTRMAPPSIPHRGSTAPHGDSDASAMSPFHRDSNASALSEMNMVNRNNSVSAGTTIAMPNPAHQAMYQNKVEELAGIGNAEEFNPTEFVNEAMLRLGEEEN